MAELYKKAKEASLFVEQVPGAADVIVEQAMGLPQLVVHYDRAKIARYGMNIEELNTIIRTAYAGEAAGVVFENERRFDLVLRLDNDKVADLNLDKLFVRTARSRLARSLRSGWSTGLYRLTGMPRNAVS